MKTRYGYVSNSSSSSFCIVGVKCLESYFNIDIEQFKSRLEDIGFEKSDVDKMNLSELMLNLYHCLFGNSYYEMFGDLVIVDGISEYNGDVIAGLDITRMTDDETLIQFKEKVLLQLQKIGYFGELKDIKIYIDGG